MRSVGGKAGGFINKKFFHPSSFRNQEKLWKAQTADAMEQRKQDDMEKAREEERKVEALRKEMYLAGQASHGGFVSAGTSESNEKGSWEQIKANRELKRRKQILREERAAKTEEAQEADDDVEVVEISEAPEAGEEKPGAEEEKVMKVKEEEAVAPRDLSKLVKSRYQEDVMVGGHKQVWGSWWTPEGQRWGFACCETTDFGERCPHAPPELTEEESGKKARGEPRGKRRRRGAAESVETSEVSRAPATSGAAE
eukprot:CAMPEP_0197634934 /NCGR_PEP_ID=MMETSP1338-20131121/10889_1 /TAXON_ID=43686 ORGANISM="Pelagodinium beii, Strain RCC1491" /NCGR_SAMPLE_ID=MMETSP1338 /ASSEMBLY_ACC=CAM_ASM_000754 /LENGTH=253 /DNA_ID=CAMNT_0043206891 /DNA_START=130 /DNA_END=888 /DNA_ORIENTATION=-